MGSTTRIEDIDGNLLWAPDSVSGKYSVSKTKEIADILEELLGNVNLSMNMKVDEESLSNIYTKTQADERFVINSNFDSLLQSKVSELVVNGIIPSNTSLDLTNSRLLSLWTACHGTNFNGEVVQNISYDSSLSDHENKIYANTQDILRVINDLYYKGSDGSTVDFNNPRFAMWADTGKTEDLSSVFSGTNRSSLAKAINYVYTLIDNRNTLIGSGTLKTNANTLVGGVNELYDSKADASTVATLSTQLNNITQYMPGTGGTYYTFVSRVSTLENRVSNIETLDGTATLQTTNKTLKGAINELRSSINNVESSLSGLSSDIDDVDSSVSSVSSKVGTLSSLDSSVSSTSLVGAINKLVSVVSGLDTRLSALEAKVNTNPSGD